MIRIILILGTLLISGCAMKKEKVDLLVCDATVYTVDNEFSKVEAFVVRDGRIIETGSNTNLQKRYDAESTISLKGKFVYPGWIDAHCHFTGYGLSLFEIDLAGTNSVEEIIERCKSFAEEFNPDWITGRGWDQNDWEVKVFPGKEVLDAAFPDRPVLLRRVDGHAGWANSRALEIAGVTPLSSIDGGEVKVENGKTTGILIDNGIILVNRMIPRESNDYLEKCLLAAEKSCFSVGLTSVTDCGLDTREVMLIDSLQRSGALKMRINVMLNPTESNFNTYIENGPSRNELMTIGTLKLYADGALGSRGARMMEPYSDDPGNSGLFVTPLAELKKLSERALQHNFQVAVHCIGDDANRQILKMFGSLLAGPNERRWRIEHAQIIHPGDFAMFSEYNIIPSVQPTHATSDMYWAGERIGPERMKGAYSYKTLLEQNGWIPCGSDFPVEDINPLFGFYAAVARRDKEGFPEGGFRSGEALTREQALRAMTIWAARAGFEEDIKGSIERGKLADFVVSDVDIMTAGEYLLPDIPVTYTYSNGVLVYER